MKNFALVAAAKHFLLPEGTLQPNRKDERIKNKGTGGQGTKTENKTTWKIIYIIIYIIYYI